MAIEAGRTYNATITGARMTHSSVKGTLGVLLTFETDEGDISKTLYLTHKTADRVRDTLTKLGADPEQLKSQTYLDNLGMVIVGRECEITTVDDEYNGKHRVEVQWINERKAQGASAEQMLGRAAYLFGGPKPPTQTQPSEPAPFAPISDDDVPF